MALLVVAMGLNDGNNPLLARRSRRSALFLGLLAVLIRPELRNGFPNCANPCPIRSRGLIERIFLSFPFPVIESFD